MLILSRKSGEAVVVPQLEIVFRILEVHGNQVRVGISAPRQVEVFRTEVWNRIQQLRGSGTRQESDDAEVPGDESGAVASSAVPSGGHLDGGT